MKRFQQLIWSFIQDCLAAHSKLRTLPKDKMDQKNEVAYWLYSINQESKQASKIVNYDLTPQVLTNKDQRAVLPRSFLAIASAPATAIVVLCKKRYVR